MQLSNYKSGAEVLTNHGLIFQFIPSAAIALISYIKSFLQDLKSKTKREHISNITKNKYAIDKIETYKSQISVDDRKKKKETKKLKKYEFNSEKLRNALLNQMGADFLSIKEQLLVVYVPNNYHELLEYSTDARLRYLSEKGKIK